MSTTTIMANYRISVGNHQFNLDQEALEKIDIQNLKTASYHIIHKAGSIQANVESSDLLSREFIVEIEGTRHTVKIEDTYDLLVEKMGLQAQSGQTSKHIYAPMPGLILDIMATEGGEFQKGDGLIVLEAMKMENMLKAPGDATIEEVKVKKGDTVEKGQLLMVLG